MKILLTPTRSGTKLKGFEFCCELFSQLLLNQTFFLPPWTDHDPYMMSKFDEIEGKYKNHQVINFCPFCGEKIEICKFFG